MIRIESFASRLKGAAVDDLAAADGSEGLLVLRICSRDPVPMSRGTNATLARKTDRYGA